MRRTLLIKIETPQSVWPFQHHAPPMCHTQVEGDNADNMFMLYSEYSVWTV